MRWTRDVERMGDEMYVSVLVCNPEGKRTLGRMSRKREDNIKMVVRKWDVRTWNGSSWLRIGRGGGHL